MELQLIRLEEVYINELTKIMERAFDEDTRIHLDAEKGGPDGYSIMQNGGEFNDIGHYHLHIFPRYVGDGFGWTYGSEKKAVNSEIAQSLRKSLERG